MNTIHQAQHSHADHLTKICITRLQAPNFAQPPSFVSKMAALLKGGRS